MKKLFLKTLYTSVLLAVLTTLPLWADASPPIERLAIWCEFMPYKEVEACLPLLKKYDCDLLLHVEWSSFDDPDFPTLLKKAAEVEVGVDAWLLLPYEEHLYVGQASVESVRKLALAACDFFDTHRLAVNGFVFDCEPSPLLGRELFAAVVDWSPRQLIRTLKREMDVAAFETDIERLNTLIADLRRRGYTVDGAANRAFLDTQSRGNISLEDAMNAPVSGLAWNHLSFITYRYMASQISYVGMLNRYATLANRLYGPRAAMDVGLIGDYTGIPENEERAKQFGGEKLFYSYLQGMKNVKDIKESVGVVLGCGVTRINLYALDGAVTSVAGLELWLQAARDARPLNFWGRWTPMRSLQYGALGALTEKGFRWFTGGSQKIYGKVVLREPEN